jgi:Family of unknown function (DUF6152)
MSCRKKGDAMRTPSVLLLVLALHVGAAPALAHHSFAAEFDAKQPIKLTGTVTKVEWTNPHVWFYIDVKDETGKVTNWGMEMGGPNGLLRAGWTRNSMKAGDEVTVDGFKARSGRPLGNATSVVLASTGQKLFAASSQGQ